jgi:hypothetical protein
VEEGVVWIETLPMTIQRGAKGVKLTSFENSVTKGALKIAMGILATEQLATACLVQQAGQATYQWTSL